MQLEAAANECADDQGLCNHAARFGIVPERHWQIGYRGFAICIAIGTDKAVFEGEADRQHSAAVPIAAGVFVQN